MSSKYNRWFVVVLLCITLVVLVGGLQKRIRSSAYVGLAATAQTSGQQSSTVLTPSAGARGTLLLADDFDDPAHSRLLVAENDVASYMFRAGAYVISVQQPQYVARSTIGGNYANCVIEIDAAFIGGPENSAAGIMFRYQDDDNFYLFRIANTGSYSLAVYRAGQQQMLLDWTASPAINGRGQPNRLRVENDGDRIRVYANGILLGEASDTSLRAGQIALAVSTFGQGGAIVQFDTLTVRSLS